MFITNNADTEWIIERTYPSSILFVLLLLLLLLLLLIFFFVFISFSFLLFYFPIHLFIFLFFFFFSFYSFCHWFVRWHVCPQQHPLKFHWNSNEWTKNKMCNVNVWNTLTIHNNCTVQCTYYVPSIENHCNVRSSMKL